MDYGDLILFPVFLIILSLFFRALRNTYTDPILKRYHRQAFWVKILSCIAFIIYNVYLYPADSIGLYQKEGANIYHLILHNSNHLKWLFQKGKYFDESFLKDRFNSGYFRSEANFMVARFVAFISFVTAGRYAATSLIFACIGFSGIWKLFLFFYEQYPHLHKRLAIAVLFFPTFVFWSSGILKDTLCIASLGWITYSLYEILYRKKHLIKNTLILFVFGYILAVIKIYILISYVPFFILFIVLRNLQGIKNNFLKYLLAPFLIVICLFAFSSFFNSFNEELGVYAVEDLTSSIQHLNGAFKNMDGNATADSNFALGVEFDGTFSGLIKLAPVAVFTTFFRPFIWESHKISQMMASVESTILLLLTLFIILKAGLINFIKLVLSDPLIMYCFLFSVVFATFVGASTLNFGTLVRYKIPCLPFYIISLFLINEKVKEKSLKKSVSIAGNLANSPALLLQPINT